MEKKQIKVVPVKVDNTFIPDWYIPDNKHVKPVKNEKKEPYFGEWC